MRSAFVLLAALAGSTLARPIVAAGGVAAGGVSVGGVSVSGGLVGTIESILHGTSPANILGGIGAEAAVALNGGAIGCKAGSIDIAYRQQLGIWLKTGSGAHIDASLKTALLTWCQVGVAVDLEIDLAIRAQLSFFLPTLAAIAAQKELYVTLQGVFDFTKDVAGVLTVGAQTSLEAAIALLVEVDAKVKAGLEFCAAGGVVADLDVEIISALNVWLDSKECTLNVAIIKTIKVWLKGTIEGEVIALSQLPVKGLTAVSLGKSLEVLIDVSGAIVDSAQASLSAFLETDVGLQIDIEIKNIIESCAKGGLAIEVEYEKRVQLALWLSSSKCTLTAELKGLIIFWLSFGVSAGTDVSVNFSKNVLAEFNGFITGTIDALFGQQLHGLLSFLLSGETVLSISIEARAELSALLGGGFDISIDGDIEIIIIGWLCGCQKCCGGTPPASSTIPSLPSTTHSVSFSTTLTKTTTIAPGVPTIVVPTGTLTTTIKPGVPTVVVPTGTLTTTIKPGVPTVVVPTGTLTTTIKPGVPTVVVPTGTLTTTKPGVPTVVVPTESATQPPSTITKPPVPTATSIGGKTTVAITKTVSVDYCPPNY